MASDVMRVRLHLREIRVLAVASDTPSELRVEVESTVRRSRCLECGFGCTRVHDTRRRKVRDLEVSGRRTTLVWLRRRFVCDNCSTRYLEDHPEFENKLTRRLARRLVADARVMTLRAAARRHGLGWHLINGVVKAWSAALAEHRRSRRCRVLLVDETSMRKRHRYVTVIVNGDADRARLDALFDAHPRLKAGWQALQELHGLYLADDHQGALEALGRFCDLYENGELPEYHDIVDTFIAWSDEILAWHHTDRASNGRIEGINNLLQVLRRSAHGFTNPTNFEARGILVT